MNEQRVWIAECVCPQGHLILAGSGEAENVLQAQALGEECRERVKTFLRAKAIQPYCGACRADARTWTVNLSRTVYRSMEEAEPALQRHAHEQAVARALLSDDKSEAPVLS